MSNELNNEMISEDKGVVGNSVRAVKNFVSNLRPLKTLAVFALTVSAISEGMVYAGNNAPRSVTKQGTAPAMNMVQEHQQVHTR